MNPIDKLINEKWYRIYLDDPRFIHQVIDNNAYADVFNDLVVIDLGCNIGAFSYWIYDKAKIIYAIEPMPRCIELMTKTKEAGGLDKLKIYQMALSGTGGERGFISDPYETGGGGKLGESSFMVKTKTIDEFMKDEGIDHVDILKIDIEGGEKEIFKSKGFKDVADKIKTIIGEYHRYDPTEDLELCGYTVFDNKEHNNFVARRK